MGQIKARSPKRQLISYDSVNALKNDSTVICVNLGVLTILRALARERGLWQSTYYKNLLPGNLYEEIEQAELDVIDGLVSEFLRDTDMTTCQELTNLLQTLSTTGGGGCGCGASGAGTVDVPATTETGPPDISNPTGNPPAGFSTWDEYRDYRCAVAKTIVDELTTDIQWLQTVDVALISAGALAASLLSPIPGDELIALIAAVLIISAQGYFLTVLTELENALLSAAVDLECDLYTSTDVTDAMDEFALTLDAEIDNQTADPVARTLAKQLWRFWQSNVIYNDLFVKSDKYNLSPYVQSDCSSCVECPITVVYGSIVQNGNVYTVTSGNRATGNCPGEWALVWICDSAFNTGNPAMKQFTIGNYSGPTIDPCTTNPVNYSVAEHNQAGVATWESQDTLPPGTRCARRFYIGGLPSQFSFDITITGDC